MGQTIRKNAKHFGAYVAENDHQTYLPGIDYRLFPVILALVKTRIPTLTILLAAALVSMAGDWPHFRGPDRNGVSPETGWFPANAKLTEHWRGQVGLGFSGATVVDGRIYTVGYTDKQDTISCLNVADGSTVWKKTFKASKGALYYQGGTSATPTLSKGRLFHFSRKGELFCLDSKTGRSIWEKHLVEDYEFDKPTWGFASSPVILDDRILLNAGEAGAAIKVSDGSLIWRNGKKDAGYATPVPFTQAGHSQFALLTEKEILAISTADGKVSWRQRFESGWGQNATDPVILGGQVFVSGYNVKGKLLQLADGEPVAGFKSETKNHFNAGVLLNGHLYCFSGKAHNSRTALECMNWKTGETAWSHKGLGAGVLMAAEGKLIIVGEKGKFVIADATPEGFKPLFEKQLLAEPVWTSPTLANGRIYCRDGKGTLVCLSFTK